MINESIACTRYMYASLYLFPMPDESTGLDKLVSVSVIQKEKETKGKREKVLGF